MHHHSRIAAAVLFLAAGGALAVAGFLSGEFGLELATSVAVGFLGLVIVALGVLLLRRGLSESLGAERPRSKRRPDGAPLPLPHYTRNCPFCGRRLGLKEEKCPDCRRRLPAGETCSAGDADAVAAEDAFAAARDAALARGSSGYIWRAVRDEATCERCANNDGHLFLWEHEPIGGHAGARARCRCRPEPVFSEGTHGPAGQGGPDAAGAAPAISPKA